MTNERRGADLKRRPGGAKRMLALAVATVLLFATILPGVPAVVAQGAMRIAAVVNDEVVSIEDLLSRIALLLVTSGLPDNEQNRQRVAGHVLRQLIEETLKLQEARRAGIVVEDQEIDRALIGIASQIGVPPEQLAPALASRGVRIQALISQVESEIAWLKAVSTRMQDQIQVTPEDVEARIDRLASEAGKPEYRVAEIVLSIDDPTKVAEVEVLADRVMEQLRGGVPFPSLARSFSDSGSAAVGGDLGWVRPEQLSAELRKVVPTLESGEAFGPVRTGPGFSIILLIDTRVAPPIERSSVTVTLQQLVLPIPPGADPDDVQERLQEARELAADAEDCGELAAIGRDVGSSLSGDLGTVDLAQLDEPMQRAVRPLRTGERTAPFRTGNDIVILMVCERSDGDIDPQLREQIRIALIDERMAVASRRLLRDLQRDAFVDVRL